MGEEGREAPLRERKAARPPLGQAPGSQPAGFGFAQETARDARIVPTLPTPVSGFQSLL